MNIAIVDDEPSLLKLASHTLKSYGVDKGMDISITEYTNGVDFLKEYSQGKYAMVFMDVYMPEMDGIETVLKLRKEDNKIPVVFLTTSESHMKNALNCHAFDYIVKPATREEIYRVMEECIATLDKDSLGESRYFEFTTNKIDIKISQNKLMLVSVQGHTINIIDVDGRTYSLKSSFASVSEELKDWDNLLEVNRGLLINMDYIDHFEGTECFLKNGEVYYAKVKMFKQIEQAWRDYIAKK